MNSSKINALLTGQYILIDAYRPLTKAMQDTVQTYKDITGCDVMPVADTLLHGLGINTSVDNVHFVNPDGFDKEFSSNIAPMFILDCYTAAVEDGTPECEAARQQILIRASTAFTKYSQDLTAYIDEHRHIQDTVATSEIQE